MVTLATVAAGPSALAGQLTDVNKRSTTHERIEGDGWANWSGLATLLTEASETFAAPFYPSLRRLAAPAWPKREAAALRLTV